MKLEKAKSIAEVLMWLGLVPQWIFMTRDLLAQAIAEAAHHTNVQLKQIEERQQAPDHPILWGVPESHYLDFFIFQVV